MMHGCRITVVLIVIEGIGVGQEFVIARSIIVRIVNDAFMGHSFGSASKEKIFSR
jgi:hypothetical protein